MVVEVVVVAVSVVVAALRAKFGLISLLGGSRKRVLISYRDPDLMLRARPEQLRQFPIHPKRSWVNLHLLHLLPCPALPYVGVEVLGAFVALIES